jgi:hypothetical protein
MVELLDHLKVLVNHISIHDLIEKDLAFNFTQVGNDITSHKSEAFGFDQLIETGQDEVRVGPVSLLSEVIQVS